MLVGHRHPYRVASLGTFPPGLSKLDNYRANS
jgi:hypothetical protein